MILADDGVPSPDGTPEGSPLQWPGTELAQSHRFMDVRQSTIERRTTMSARDYIGHLSTISAYIELPVSVREHVFDRILRVLPEAVTLVADITLHLARRDEHDSDQSPSVGTPMEREIWRAPSYPSLHVRGMGERLPSTRQSTPKEKTDDAVLPEPAPRLR